MESSPAARVSETIKTLLLLYSALAKRHQEKRPEISSVTLEAIRRLHWIDVRIRATKYVAGFVGLGNVGKSTLLNALFGVAVAPRKNRPMTSACVEYHYGETFSLKIEFEGTFERSVTQCADAKELLDAIESYATEEGSNATDQISAVRAYLPADILSKGLIVADTPGFGAAQLNGGEGTHEATLVKYLPKIHQVF